MKYKYRKRIDVLLFLGPGFIGFIFFYMLPYCIGFYYSLLDNPIKKNFVWFSNYINLIRNPVFIKALINTFIFTIISVPLLIIVSLILALLLNKKNRYTNIFQTLIISPLVVPSASIVLVWLTTFNPFGTMNKILTIHLCSAGLV